MMAKPSIHVAIALLFHRGKVLVGWRNAEQHQGNKHEFPGGKFEEKETPIQACRREVMEEVGIDLTDWHNFDFVQHDYDDLQVNLHFFHTYVDDTQLAIIVEPWTWFKREELDGLNFPKANQDIVNRLVLPQHIKITTDLSDIVQLAENTLLYWRMQLKVHEIQTALSALPNEQLAKIMLNVVQWQQLSKDLQQRIGFIHFKQNQLIEYQSKDRPQGVICIAACHDLSSLQQAQQIGVDAAILSPVQATNTHPDVQPLGWTQFSEFTKAMDIPVYALGGMKPSDLEQIQQHQGYGVAGISNF